MSKTRSNTPRPDRRPDALASKMSQSFQRTDFAALIVERASTPHAPAWMADAQSKDASARKSAREMYERCLEIYRTVVRPQDTKYDDAGAALAFFVAMNLSALHDLPATPAVLLLLERQLLGLARRVSGWDSASISQRQFYFEEMAMLGAFMAGLADKARSEGVTARVKVRETARLYLHHLLGMDPDLLTFGEHGLVLRPASDEAHRTA